MKVGIDASNIISGGGLTHLCEILKAVDLNCHDIEFLDVWAPQKTLNKIHHKKGIQLKNHPYLNGNIVQRQYWQYSVLTDYAKNNYDILYVPGGSYIGNFRPYVTMNRNLLPFDQTERRRYGWSAQAFRMHLLEKVQSYSYGSAAGIIFLTEVAKRLTEQKTGKTFSKARVVPHGIAEKFFQNPKSQHSIDHYTFEKPFRFLYASNITLYKHQWHVIKAIQSLRDQNYPVTLDIAGEIVKNKGRERFKQSMNTYDPNNEFIFFHGHQSPEELLQLYHNADGFVFASSCETFGQILLEAMASGLPIASSDRSAMPEVLHNAGRYFDPEVPKSISRCLKKLLDSADLRRKISHAAYKRAQNYSWGKCADETFSFIRQVYKQCG